MPQATDIVVDDGEGGSSTFTLLTPSAGFGTPAEWANKVGATSVAFPTLTLSATKTTNKSRKARVHVVVPATYEDVATGLPAVSSAFTAHLEISVPDSFPENQKDEAVAFVTNLIGSALVKSCIRDGLPAT